MMVREATVAGMFYPAGESACRRAAGELFAEAEAALSAAGAPALPERIVAGIVPHAGYAYSGEVAARTLAAVARRREPAVFVIFGAAHRPGGGDEGLLFDRGAWETPLGPIEVDERLAERVLGQTNVVRVAAAAHLAEHSIEVQLPLVRFRFPAAKLLPILTPPGPRSVDVGLAVARTLEIYDADAVVLGSTDLTHYGPRYGFAPQGVGAAALRWAKEQNDASLIEAIGRLDAEAIVPLAERRMNACGAGAVAATVAAARRLGAASAVVLEHTTSYEAASARSGERPAEAVGYLSAVMG